MPTRYEEEIIFQFLKVVILRMSWPHKFSVISLPANGNVSKNNCKNKQTKKKSGDILYVFLAFFFKLFFFPFSFFTMIARWILYTWWKLGKS